MCKQLQKEIEAWVLLWSDGSKTTTFSHPRTYVQSSIQGRSYVISATKLTGKIVEGVFE